MNHYTHINKGTCSRKIDFDIDNGIVHNVVFEGGCHGNLQAIPALVEGKEASEVISRVKGIKCGYKNTSCADQLAQALIEALDKEGIKL